jgi:hypothetical protein
MSAALARTPGLSVAYPERTLPKHCTKYWKQPFAAIVAPFQMFGRKDWVTKL